MTVTRHETRHVPTRRCIACGNVSPKPGLLRLVRTSTQNLTIDYKQNMPGRGAYVCLAGMCWECAVRRKLFSRALRSTVMVSPTVHQEAMQLLQRHDEV